jgi:FkbM family methyltransferase
VLLKLAAVQKVVNLARALYRRVAGPQRALSDIPLAAARLFHGETAVTNKFGFPLEYDLRDSFLSGFWMFHAVYEPENTAFFKRTIAPGDVVVDAGANVGYFTVLFGKLVGNSGKVLALEPAPRARAILARNVKRNGLEDRVTIFPGACGDVDGETTLYTNPYGNLGDNRLWRDGGEAGAKASRDWRSFTVPVARLDTLLASMSKVDLVKTDLQGYESHAIRGLRTTIERNPTVVLLMEYWPYGLRRCGSGARDYLDLLNDLGLRTFVPDKNGTPVPVDPAELLTGEDDPDFARNLIAARPGRF